MLCYVLCQKHTAKFFFIKSILNKKFQRSCTEYMKKIFLNVEKGQHHRGYFFSSGRKNKRPDFLIGAPARCIYRKGLFGFVRYPVVNMSHCILCNYDTNKLSV